jgi:PST family polysaccharide transporter
MIKLLKQSFWTSIGNNSSSFFVIISTIILARYISPETFGIYFFCLAIREIISNLCSPSLPQTYLFSKGTYNDLKYVYKLNHFYSLVIITVSTICAFSIEKNYGEAYRNIIIIFGIISVINNYSGIFLSINERRMEFKGPSILRSISVILSLILTCICALIIGDSINVLILKELIFSILLFATSIRIFLKIDRKINAKYKNNYNYLFKYSLKSYLPKITEVLSYKIFEILTAGMLSKNILGLFNQTINIIKAPYKFLGSITDNILFVHFRNNNKKTTLNNFINIQNLILIFIIPIILFFNFFNYEIIIFILGIKWIESSKILGLLSIFLTILPFYNSLTTVYQASNNQRFYTISNLLVLLTQITFIIILPKNIENFILSFCGSFLLATFFLSFFIYNVKDFKNKKILKIFLLLLTIIIPIIVYYYSKSIFCLFIIIAIWIYLIFQNKNLILLIAKKWKN